jgi:hypothetical protein
MVENRTRKKEKLGFCQKVGDSIAGFEIFETNAYEQLLINYMGGGSSSFSTTTCSYSSRKSMHERESSGIMA